MAAAFREWVQSEGLTASGSVDGFQGTTFVVDADDYLIAIITATHTREPLLPAHGGRPFTLQKLVDRDLAHLKAANITPIFVFSGLDVAAKDRNLIGRESRRASKVLEEAWRVYDLGEAENAVSAFGKACAYRTQHIVRWLHDYLHKAGISVQVAPYLAAAQVVQIERDGFAQAIVGGASCLALGADKVITKLDWANEQLVWVEVRYLLGKFLMQLDQFIDLMIISGCTFVPPHPEVDLESRRVAAAHDMMRRSGQDGYAACVQSRDEAFLESFKKARFAIRHPVVLTSEGKVEVKNADSLPNDSHEFIGQQLPEEVYFYLSCGVVGPRVLNWRARREIFETPPLDGGNSRPFRELVQDKLRPLRTQALALFTRPLHRYYQKTDIELTCWFAENEKRSLGIPDRSEILEPPSIPADEWRVKEATMASFDAPSGPIGYALHLIAEGKAPNSTASVKLSTPNELLYNAMWRFLDDREYVRNRSLTPWGKVIKNALEHARTRGCLDTVESSTETEEAILLAFELLRLDVLNAKNMFPSPAYTGAPNRGSESDKQNTLLISRLASLVRFRHKAIGYTGPLSRHLLAFHQMATAVRESLRDLVEMHACYLLLSGAADRDVSRQQLTDFGARLPFGYEPDLGFSLVVKSYLSELSSDSPRTSDVTVWFVNATDIHGDLEKAWALWSAVNAGVQSGDVVSSEVRKKFKSADEWLQQKLQGARMVNGAA